MSETKFQPTYEALLELANWVAGEEFILRRNSEPAHPPLPDAVKLRMLSMKVREQKRWARNALEGKPMLVSGTDRDADWREVEAKYPLPPEAP